MELDRALEIVAGADEDALRGVVLQEEAAAGYLDDSGAWPEADRTHLAAALAALVLHGRNYPRDGWHDPNVFRHAAKYLKGWGDGRDALLRALSGEAVDE